MLVVGEAGIGTTRLAQELAVLAGGRDVAVARGRCVDTEGAPPFCPWRQVLRAFGVTDVVATDAVSAHDRFRAVDAAAAAVLAATERRPLLVVLDDVHWADESSLLVLRHLADRAPDAPLLLVATLRETERAGALPDLHRAPDAERLALRRLDEADVGRQLVELGASGEGRPADRRNHTRQREAAPTNEPLVGAASGALVRPRPWSPRRSCRSGR